MDIFEGHQEVRERLLGDATHRMKNWMGGITGFAALLMKDLEEQPGCYAMANRISENILRLDTFLLDLMMIIRERKLNLEQVDVPSACREVFSGYFADDEETAIPVPFDLVMEVKKISISADPIVFRNALYHSLRFTDIVSKKIHSVILTTVTDEILLTFTFIPDVSVDHCFNNIIQGMGELESIDARMSLAACIKLINLHGGHVFFEKDGNTRRCLVLRMRKD